jgi:hypothetical protein
MSPAGFHDKIAEVDSAADIQLGGALPRTFGGIVQEDLSEFTVVDCRYKRRCRTGQDKRADVWKFCKAM